MTVGIMKAERENFGHKGPDLPLREIDHRRHLFPHEVCGAIKHSDLRGRFLNADICAKIDL